MKEKEEESEKLEEKKGQIEHDENKHNNTKESLKYDLKKLKEDNKTLNQELKKIESNNSLEHLNSIANDIYKSGLAPDGLKPEAIAVIIQSGKELGIPPINALRTIYVVKGRLSLGVHSIAAIIRKFGIYYETLEYFTDVLDEDGNAKGLPPNSGFVVNTNKMCKIRFYIPVPKNLPNSQNGYQIMDSEFTLIEAILAGVVKDNSAWVKYPRVQLWNRTFTIGAKRAAPHILAGMLETAEAADIEDVDYDVDDEGKVTILENE